MFCLGSTSLCYGWNCTLIESPSIAFHDAFCPCLKTAYILCSVYNCLPWADKFSTTYINIARLEFLFFFFFKIGILRLVFWILLMVFVFLFGLVFYLMAFSLPSPSLLRYPDSSLQLSQSMNN